MGKMYPRTRHDRLQLKRPKKRDPKKLIIGLIILAGAAVLIYLAALYLPLLWKWVTSEAPAPPTKNVASEVVVTSPQPHVPAEDKEYDKKQLAGIIGSRNFKPDEIHAFEIEDENGNTLFVRTTLDPELQAWATQFMPKVKAKSTALVVLDPSTGDVLAMASYRSDGRPANLAVESSFPAASLFKIVTAAAAMEKKKIDSDTTLAYDGGKYSLRKKDIKGGIKKGRNQVTLEKGFAQSINTVFGKLGAFTLGPKALESFAQRFYFNQPIEFEMEVEKSKFSAPKDEDPYRLAELASGFNRTTKLSPLHGAMLTSAIINDGILMEPTVVREVFDKDNNIFYEHKPVSLGPVVSPATVKELRKLMRATVNEGTGRKGFGDAKKHKILGKLDIGGKSGTINNDEGNRVDWFACFARRKGTNQAIGLAAVVVHNKIWGLRSQKIIREAIIHYFSPRLAEEKR